MGPPVAAARFQVVGVAPARFQVVAARARSRVAAAVAFRARRPRDGIFLRAAAFPAVDEVILARPIRTGPILAGAGTITRLAETLADETILLAGFTRDAVTTTADASGLARTSVLESASPSAGATLRAMAAATMTDGAIGSQLPAMSPRTHTTDTDRPYF
jgi:hypothetical protein